MKASTRNNLNAWAIEWAITRADPEFPTLYQQKSIVIYSLLLDGAWHNAIDIGSSIGLSDRTTRNLMGVLKKPFGIASNSSTGYRLELLKQEKSIDRKRQLA